MHGSKQLGADHGSDAAPLLGPLTSGRRTALIEAQSHHIVRCLKQARRRGARRVEVSQEANDRYFAEMMRKRHRQIFWEDSCQLANSYYFDKNGDVPLRPASTVEAYWRSRRFPLRDYSFTA